jgi:molybdenum cofactor biosynthesis enzyme MoaA
LKEKQKEDDMKKCLLGWITVFALPVIGIAAYKTIVHSFKQKTVDKTVSVAIYKENSYKAKVYDCTYAEIQIDLEKVNGKNRIHIWDTTFHKKLLRQYPFAEKAFSRKLTVEKVVDKKEHLEINYLIKYNSNGSILQMQNGSIIADTSGKLSIGI